MLSRFLTSHEETHNGFFDETMLQEDRITAASLKKRAGNTKEEIY